LFFEIQIFLNLVYLIILY